MFNLVLSIRSLLHKTISSLIVVFFINSTVLAGGVTYSSFIYSVEGQGQDIVLIPGLMSDGRIWLETAEALAQKNRVHIINIAGFGRTPSAETNTINKLQLELGDYISKLDKPILMGHSLGGFLALSLAIENSDDIESVISVDGLPFIGPVFTHNSNTKVSDISYQANYIKSRYAKFSKEQLRAEVSRGIGR